MKMSALSISDVDFLVFQTMKLASSRHLATSLQILMMTVPT